LISIFGLSNSSLQQAHRPAFIPRPARRSFPQRNFAKTMHHPVKTSMIRCALMIAANAGLITANAQTAAAPPAAAATQPGIEFRTVAEALKALEARDGIDTVATHAEGWVTINEPAAAAQWTFTPPGHDAYPAVVRRIIRRGSNGKYTVETTSLCEAAQDKCSQLVTDFESMNGRITEAVGARSRKSGSQP
jgi:Flp pilus assembly protein CpaB